VVRIDENTLHYSITGERWRVQGEGLGGTFLGLVEISEGRLELGGTHAEPLSSLSGRIAARIRGNTRVVYAFPSGFKPWGNGGGGACAQYNTGGLVPDCGCADASDSPFGFGIAGGFSVSLDGELKGSLDGNGITGQGKVKAHFDGFVAVKWPGTGWFSDCSQVVSVAGDGTLDAEYKGGRMRLRGTVAFTDPGGDTSDAEFDYEW
jgi:hypothetical protein